MPVISSVTLVVSHVTNNPASHLTSFTTDLTTIFTCWVLTNTGATGSAPLAGVAGAGRDRPEGVGRG